jgi:hypothetical protein
MQAANRHDLRVLLRRLGPTALDTRRMLGLFRRILYRLHQPAGPKKIARRAGQETKVIEM